MKEEIKERKYFDFKIQYHYDNNTNSDYVILENQAGFITDNPEDFMLCQREKILWELARVLKVDINNMKGL